MARAPVTELNERFGLKLPEADEYATIGGLVVERLGHIPKPGEQLKAGDITMTVLRSDARAVREVMLHLGAAARAPSTHAANDRKTNPRNSRLRRVGQTRRRRGI